MKQGYAFGTRIRLSEEIFKNLKMYKLSHYYLFGVKFRLITVLLLAILSAGSYEIFNFLFTSMQEEYNIPELQNLHGNIYFLVR